MPPGAPHHSFIRPYPIRVDAFATPNWDASFTPPALHLLTHTHTDHINGLDARSFGGMVICSPVAKQMLLRYERGKDRVMFDQGIIHERVRPCSHLKTEPRTIGGKLDYTFSRDLLVRCLWTCVQA